MSSMTAHPVVRAAQKQKFEFIGLLLRAKTGMAVPRMNLGTRILCPYARACPACDPAPDHRSRPTPDGERRFWAITAPRPLRPSGLWAANGRNGQVSGRRRGIRLERPLV